MIELIDTLRASLFANPVYPLLLAGALGLLIGASIGRLVTLGRARRVNGRLQDDVQRLQRDVSQLGDERDSARQLGERQRELADDAERRAEAAEAQQDALSVHARLQAQRIQSLEAEVLASEERLVCLQGDLAQRRRRDTGQPRQVGTGPLPLPVPATRDSVPVLNKRVDDARPDGARPLIDEELDAPVPADTDLPESVDALTFDDDDERIENLVEDLDDFFSRE